MKVYLNRERKFEFTNYIYLRKTKEMNKND